MHKYQSTKYQIYFFNIITRSAELLMGAIRGGVFSGFKGQWIKQVKLPFVPFPPWIRSHPVICSINGRKVDALQLTGFNVYFRVQCGVKMWIDLVC